VFKKLVALLLIILIFALLIWRIKGGGKSIFEKSGPASFLEKEGKKYDYQWVSWEDSAGFAFEHPQQVKINNHSEDKDNYAHLTLSHPDHQGEITIVCNDSEDEDIDTWLENNEKIKGVSSLETKIASVSGLKLALREEKEMVAFIDWDEVLYTINFEAQNQNYWQPVYRHILKSFKLIPLEGETQNQFQDWFEGFDTEGADIVEPVEVIE